MAKVKESFVYEVTIGGLYFGSRDGETDLFPYEVTVVMDQEMVDQGVLSAFCKYYAQDAIGSKHSNYIRYYTHEVRRTVVFGSPDTPITDLSLFNYDQLVAHVAAEELPIETALYEDAGTLRDAIERQKKDPDIFARAQEKLSGRKSKTVKLKSKARELMSLAAAKPSGKKGAKDDLGI